MASRKTTHPRQILVLQGGGALGSYQAGTYEALRAGGAEPTWVVGISIGAVNAAIIAGNAPEKRVEQLRKFWEMTSAGMMAHTLPIGDFGRSMLNEASAAWIAAIGVPGFFKPRMPPALFYPPGAPEALSFYDSAPLRDTLLEVVDFDRINNGEVRFSVGAVNVRTGKLRFFDNREEEIGPEHIMASGALPPGLPPVEIDGHFYWDGGVVSNTPLDYVLDHERVEDLLIYQVDLFSAHGPMPRTVLEAVEREKDIRFASRSRHNSEQALRIHHAKRAVRDLLAKLPPDLAKGKEAKLLAELAKDNSVTVVRLIYRQRQYEGNSKDYEFSRIGMLEHWAAGAKDVERALHRCAKFIETPPAGGALMMDPGGEENEDESSLMAEP